MTTQVLIQMDMMKDVLKVTTMARIKPASGGAGDNQQPTQNGTRSISGTSKSQEVPNNIKNNDVCDPAHQFCAMTNPLK